MKRILAAATATAVIGAGALLAPNPAHAVAEWVIPTIIGAGAVGIAVGASAAAPSYHYAAPAGTITVESACHIERRIVNGVWQRVRVCPY